MKTQLCKPESKPSIKNFKTSAIKADQLVHIKGGDGDTPPDDGDGVIGVEDIVIG